MLINLLASSDVNTDGDEKFSWYLHRIYSSRLMLEFLFFFYIELGLRHTGFNLGFVVAAFNRMSQPLYMWTAQED